MSNIRIRTTPNGNDNYVKINLEQDFDFIEILSLKISQEEVYRRFYSDYGVVVGRVIVNSGVGVPNAKVSIFIPLENSDADNDEIKSIYPYINLQETNSEGVRYNLLPNDYQGECHTPVGTFPTKSEILDNETLLEVYEKYYKFTTTTNKSGDFMLFGVPVGNHMLNVDVDLSDIGIFSQRPYDFIEQGSTSKTFKSPTKFKDGKNLNNLAQLKHQEIGVNVISFWGESLANEVGITRVDIDLNYNIRPAAIFVGSIFGDNEKNSVNKNCAPRKDLGRICETVSSEGTVEMIRKTVDGQIERFDIEGGRVIDDHGAWAYQIPMNLDYMVTDEFGDLIPSEDTTRGIPTRTRVRFKIGMDSTGGEGRLRTRAKFLVPHNPINSDDQDFTFDENTSDNHFRDFRWNKIYTVRNHITRIQSSCSINCADNRRMVGIKDVDNCVGTKNPFPFNRLDADFNPVFSILCIILGIIIAILTLLNGILSLINGIRIPVIRVYPFRGVKCVTLTCDGNKFAPGCSRRASPTGTVSQSGDRLHECYKIQMAESLNVYEFDFYNDWVNGTLFSFLLKYKKKRNNEKFCSTDRSEDIFIVDTLNRGNLKDENKEKIYHGIVKNFDGELFYAPYDKDKEYMLYATDVYNLGSVFDCDWEGKPSIHNSLISTTYQIPPFMIGDEIGVTEMANDGSSSGSSGLLFDLTCIAMKVTQRQIDSIKRICEIGVGLDEDRFDEPDGLGADRTIRNDDIENQLIRDLLIYLNDNLPPTLPYSSGFGDRDNNIAGQDYINYRDFLNREIYQSRGNSFYFYFGSSPNNSALDKMNNKYFTTCEQVLKPDFIISGVTSDVTTINGNDGSIDVEIVGGAEPFIYIWSNGESSQDINNLTSGVYSVTVVDFNGSTVRRTFIINEPQPIYVDFNVRNTVGVGTATGKIFINSIIGGNNDYILTLTGPSGNITINNPVTIYEINNLLSGEYTLTVVDSAGTPAFNVTIIIEDPTPLEFLSPIMFKSSECNDPNNSAIEISIIGGVLPYTITTDGPLVFDVGSNTDIPYNETPQSHYLNQYELNAGTYTVTIVDAIGQTLGPISGDITIPEMLVVDIEPVLEFGITRLRLEQYEYNKIYDFFLNDTGIIIGSVDTHPFVGDPDTWVFWDYENLEVGDVIFVRERDAGCDSNIITIT